MKKNFTKGLVFALVLIALSVGAAGCSASGQATVVEFIGRSEATVGEEYRFEVKTSPASVKVECVVTDPDGEPVNLADEYAFTAAKPGQYSVTLRVEGKEKQFIYKIDAVDNVAPTVADLKDIVVAAGDSVPFGEILSQAEVTDNWAEPSQISREIESVTNTKNGAIVSDGPIEEFTFEESGEYRVSAIFTDPHANVARKTFNISVVPYVTARLISKNLMNYGIPYKIEVEVTPSYAELVYVITDPSGAVSRLTDTDTFVPRQLGSYELAFERNGEKLITRYSLHCDDRLGPTAADIEDFTVSVGDTVDFGELLSTVEVTDNYDDVADITRRIREITKDGEKVEYNSEFSLHTFEEAGVYEVTAWFKDNRGNVTRKIFHITVTANL